MKVIGIGLPRTGNTSLKAFLTQYGMRCGQYDNTNAFVGDWNRYDAMVDFPMCVMFPHLLSGDPSLKAILTTRETSSIWRSTREHCTRVIERGPDSLVIEMLAVLQVIYGTPLPLYEDIHRVEHLRREHAEPFIQSGQVLVLPVDSPTKAEDVCQFLGLENKGVDYPHER